MTGLFLVAGIFATLAPMRAGTQAPSAGMIEVQAAAAATVRPEGPRGGERGAVYLDVEGRNNGNNASYASFGVLDFRPEKPSAPVGQIAAVEIVLVQSVARFSHDGPLELYLAPGPAVETEVGKSPLKFDTKATNGIGEQLGPLVSLGKGTFRKSETGKADTHALTLSDAARAHVLDRLNAGQSIRVIVAPGDHDVAATYFGASPRQASQRPRLVIRPTASK